MLTEVGRQFDVVPLCLTSATSRDSSLLPEAFARSLFRNYRSIVRLETRAATEAAISVNDLIASEFIMRNEAFVAEFVQHAGRSAAVVFEHPYLAPLLELLTAEMPVVYSSLNVESDLKGALLTPRRDAALRMELVHTLEKRLLDRADLVSSKRDRARFPESSRQAVRGHRSRAAPTCADMVSGPSFSRRLQDGHCRFG